MSDPAVERWFHEYWDNPFWTKIPTVAVYTLRKGRLWKRAWPSNWSSFCESALGITGRIGDRMADEGEKALSEMAYA